MLATFAALADVVVSAVAVGLSSGIAVFVVPVALNIACSFFSAAFGGEGVAVQHVVC